MYTINPLTPPLTPSSPFTSARPSTYKLRTRSPRTSALPSTPEESPEFLSLPPPIESVMPDFDLPDAMMSHMESEQESERYCWKAGMSPEEKDIREGWLSSGRGRRGLRIVIVTENFLPKVDGVTRTLARLLEHLRKEGHDCMLLGPTSDRETYAGHPLVGTTGVPLVVYPGLKLNFLRPKFLRTIRDFQPDVVHFVDPIWLGAQTLMAMELGWAGEDWVAEEGPALGAGIAGAVVASYHTNLATYATLFGMSWLEPIMWRLQRWLYSKTLLTLCPSPSTRGMLESQAFSGVRLWPRGVDLTQFGPSKRSLEMRASWGVGTIQSGASYDIASVHTNGANWGAGNAEVKQMMDAGVHYQGRRASMPLTPPASPWVTATEPVSSIPPTLPERVVLLYVGRISWEKNLHLLLAAYANIPAYLPTGAVPPKLVFVGDGPARTELEGICAKSGYDATFMGHRSGEELATCYASGDVFAFPSFTETFGQVVLEALASGLPVIGLDAEGTRDLVQHQQTGLLLPLLTTSSNWSIACQPSSSHFKLASQGYAQLLARAVTNHEERRKMGLKASTDGVKGFTWWDAMESCVDGYRESIRISREKRRVKVVCHSSTPTSQFNADTESTMITPASSSPKISRVNRVVSRRLAKGRWELDDTCETLWHLKNVLKAVVVIWMFWAIYSHHQYSKVRGLEI